MGVFRRAVILLTVEWRLFIKSVFLVEFCRLPPFYYSLNLHICTFCIGFTLVAAPGVLGLTVCLGNYEIETKHLYKVKLFSLLAFHLTFNSHNVISSILSR